MWRAKLNPRKVAPYLFLLPFLVIFAAFQIYPLIYGVIISFYRFRGLAERQFVGLDNYVRLLNNPQFYQALENTTYYTLGTLIILIPIPVILAVLLNSKLTRASSVYQTASFLPALTSLVVVGAVFRLLLDERGGLVNAALQAIGVAPQKWLNSAALVIPSLLILAFWRWAGINIIYFLSGLTAIPHELYEAAEIDGATGLRRFWHITLPLLKPVIVFVTIISTIGGYQLFTEVYVLWPQGGTPGNAGLTLALALYRAAFRSFDLGYAGVLGVVMGLIIMVVSVIQFKLFGFFRDVE